MSEVVRWLTSRRFHQEAASRDPVIRVGRPQVQRIAVLVGTLDEPFDFKPNFHCYTESAMPWLKNLDNETPRFETWSEDAGMVPPTDYNPKQGLNREIDSGPSEMAKE